MSRYSVSFYPENTVVMIDGNDSLLYAINLAGIPVKASCGGRGMCGSCGIIIKEGRVKMAEGAAPGQKYQGKEYLPACRCFPLSSLVIEVPTESRLTGQQVLLDTSFDSVTGILNASSENKLCDMFSFDSPVYRKITIDVPEPSLNDPIDDLSRLIRAIHNVTGLEKLRPTMGLLRVLPAMLRRGGWKVAISLAAIPGSEYTEMDYVEPGCENDGYFGLAVDVGTTTVVAQLVDLESGTVTCTKGAFNKQASFGDDVITRIIYAGEHGVSVLQAAILDTINDLIDEIIEENSIKTSDIKTAICAGNTTMTHILLGLDPSNIRLEPYTPVANKFPALRAAGAGLNIYQQAWVHLAPGTASYMGGDITAGLLVTGMAFADDLSLFIDIGTNGEMVLGNKEWFISCACSAGPAFEGWGIKHGMRACPGAIERVVISQDGQKVKYDTVGNNPPLGICGSGLIDALSWLYKAGVIDRTGSIIKDPEKLRIRETVSGREFVLAWAGEAGNAADIYLSEAEIKNLIRSKAAVYAGIRTMLHMVGLPLEAISRVFIAGGFGRQINIRAAISIGMLPDIAMEKYNYIGNSSVKGARLALLSGQAREMFYNIADKITYLELSSGNLFMDEFISSLFIPHTELALFPTVEPEAGL
jgi:uncharacterized 2Fe-2S/4Fe-4S cluster protein (DUF4445 family)